MPPCGGSNATGWMHNRLRMIVASFLAKDLRLDWRQGERHFMSQLIDGDLAANNGGWQWAASTGTDAAPYFRIFNRRPRARNLISRASLFAAGCRNWLKRQKKALHQPWLWADKQGVTAGIRARWLTISRRGWRRWRPGKPPDILPPVGGFDLHGVIQPDDQHQADAGQRAPGDLAGRSM